MGITVSREIVQNLTAGAKVLFAESWASQPGAWSRLATVIASTQAVETYTWLSEIPQMREWIDERAVKGLSEYGYLLRNRKFEATIGIERDALEDEQFGQLKMRIQMLAEAAGAHYDQMVFKLIQDGISELCYDGGAFFRADHPSGGAGVISNRVNLPLTADNLADVLTRISTISLDSGEPMMVQPTHLLVPPALRFPAKRILNSAFYPEAGGGAAAIGDMAANVLQGELELIVSPRLQSPNAWYVLDCSHAVRPFIVQQRVAPELSALDGLDGVGGGGESEASFLRDLYLYGVRSRDNAGYGLWQYAFRSDGGGV